MYQILTELCRKFGDDWSFREETFKGLQNGRVVNIAKNKYFRLR